MCLLNVFFLILSSKDVRLAETADDKAHDVHVTSDGRFLVLDDQSNYGPAAAIREVHGDGDERKVEGAECESEA